MLLQALLARLRHGSPTVAYPKEAAPPTHPSFLGAPAILADQCQLCYACVDVCPTGALSIEAFASDNGTQRKDHASLVSWSLRYDSCILCSICIAACEHQAIVATGRDDLAVLNRADLVFRQEKLVASVNEEAQSVVV